MSQLNIEDLFTPASGDEWNERLITNAQTLELPTTSWQAGGISRTILAIMSNMFGQEDGIISIMAMGGFLDFAATGEVTYTAANGQVVTQKVTPDPSIPSENPNGTLGWLDLLGSSVYNEERIGAEFASNTLAIANTTSNTYGPYSAGTYHVENPTTGAGYANTENLTIAAKNIVGGAITAASNSAPIVITTSGLHGLTGTEIVYIEGVLGNTAANGFWNISVTSTTTFVLVGSSGNGAYVSGGTVNVCTTGTFQADIAGPTGTSATGTITEAVTVLDGVVVQNLVSFVGSNWESNTAYAARCRLKLQSISPNGPHGAYEYFSLTAGDILAEKTPPVALSTPVTRALVQASANDGVVITTVASASGSVSGVSQLGISGATNASPIVITTGTAHGLATSDYVTISGVLGNTNANGTYQIIVLSSTTFSLDGSSGNAAYTGGGVVEGGDLGQVNRVIQENCVPDDTVAITQSATNFDVAIVAAVEIPQENFTIYSAAVQTLLAAYFAGLPIGGIDGYIQYNDIVGILFAAGIIGTQQSYVRKITALTLNGGSVNLAYSAPTAVARLTPTPVITITGV